MAKTGKRYLYRMTHIDNIPHILQYGITHRDSPFANPDYHAIGDPSLISTRDSSTLENGKSLRTYIPFYFGVRTPMLYVIQNGYNLVARTEAKDIVYCVTSVQEIIDSKIPFIWTNGHAIDRLSQQFSMEEIERMEQELDWDAINAKFWKDDNNLDLKRRKEAEFLLEGDLAPQFILGYICYNEETRLRMVSEFSIPEDKIAVRPNFYF